MEMELDKAAYDRELFRMEEGFSERASHFGAQLYRLIAKADFGNQERLRKGFPIEVFVYQTYAHGIEFATRRAGGLKLSDELLAEMELPTNRGTSRIERLLQGVPMAAE